MKHRMITYKEATEMTGLTRDERDSLLLEFEEIPPAEMPRDMSGGVMLKGGFCPYWGGAVLRKE